jgi:3-hydroxyisobutyrate dehydrogenase
MGSHTKLGFIGLGTMGQPMALNLTRAGHPLTVWHRSPQKCVPLSDAGATIVDDVADVFRRSDVVFLMLIDSAAVDHVLRRGTPSFAAQLSGRTVVNMSSVEPHYSSGLEKDIKDAGGRFVEAPVSGSRVPAETGQLVAMVAGDLSVVSDVSPLLRPMCHEIVFCGSAGSGLRMKLAVNIFMLVLATGLAEAVHFADRQKLDRQLLQRILNAGPMSSAFSRIKLAKLVADDFSAQALARDGCNSTRLITDAARDAHIAASLMDVCRELYEETVALGHGSSDMISVIRAIEARSNGLAAGS